MKISFNSIRKAVLLTAAVLSFGLATAKEKGPIVHEKKGTAVLIEHPERMFYEIVGTDKNGEESHIYIQGTIHIADEKIYPLSEKVSQAFLNADHVYGELSQQAWTDIQMELQKKMVLSMLAAKKADKLVTDFLSEKELENLRYYLGIIAPPEQVDLLLSTYEQFEPWVLNQVLSEIQQSQIPLSAENAYDIYFKTLAEELYNKGDMSKETLGLDPLSVQIDVLTFGDYDVQLKMLKDSLHDKKALKREAKSTKKLYDAYVKGDKKKLEKLLFEGLDAGLEDPEYYFMDDYIDALFRNRNKSWAEQIQGFIEEGGNYFIYTGAGHYLGDFSVFTYLEELGVL